MGRTQDAEETVYERWEKRMANVWSASGRNDQKRTISNARLNSEYGVEQLPGKVSKVDLPRERELRKQAPSGQVSIRVDSKGQGQNPACAGGRGDRKGEDRLGQKMTRVPVYWGQRRWAHTTHSGDGRQGLPAQARLRCHDRRR